MYTLIYSSDGKVGSIQKGNMSIPICEENMDYHDFLLWNSKQEIPLDLDSTIEPIKSTPEQLREKLITEKMREMAIAELIKEKKL